MTLWSDQAPQPIEPEPTESQLWADQLAANILLTVQALQQLHAAIDAKFTRSPSHEF